MESQFRGLDRQIAAQPMPEEYHGTRAYVYCNDCTLKGTTEFHWLGLKCAVCESYNTTMLGSLLDSDGTTAPGDVTNVEGITAIAPLPINVTDEAVPIENSRAISRRPSTAISDVNEASESPWLRPQWRGARSLSPVVGNYFGLDRREPTSPEPATPSTVNHEEHDMDFWGRPFESPPPETSKEGEESEEESSSSDEEMEDMDAEEDDEEDPMDIMGHR